MKILARCALFIGAAAALLAGCGGSQPPVGAPNGMPQSRESSGYVTLYDFGAGRDGAAPKAGLIAVNGTLYGTTYAGGKHGYGTVFNVTTTGSEKVLYSFQSNSDGANPSASLIGVKGVLYGTTEYGGPHLDGTVFRISTSGVEKVLYSFQGHYYGYDGAHPVANLIDVKGKLYGTTSNGGDNSECQYSCGTVYSVSRTGKEKVLHSFQLYTDGALPLGDLIDVKGTLYGTTQAGGSISIYGPGTIFSISRTGTEKVLYNFPYHGPNGAAPLAGLTNVSGTLYGTTGYGAVYGYGTAFSITTSGTLTLLHTFGSGSDGSRPAAPLLNVHGTLYGTTELGGTYGKGTIFKMSLRGKEKVLHSFGYGSDGATPLADLIDVNGTLYGTTSAGGTYGNGTVFALTLR
ncbi:MAG TPA: choice-of-anchor tandem repeat GloVer-containing protein [Candidatus Cybelea sp.]